jgi:hypothetical protein
MSRAPTVKFASKKHATSAAKEHATPASNELPKPGINCAGNHAKRRVLVNGIAQFPVWMDSAVGAQYMFKYFTKEAEALDAPAMNSPFCDIPVLLTDRDDSSTGSDDESSRCIDANASDNLQESDSIASSGSESASVNLQESDSMASSDSESESSLEGFIDTTEPTLTLLQEKTLMRFFPIMCKSLIEKGV